MKKIIKYRSVLIVIIFTIIMIPTLYCCKDKQAQTKELYEPSSQITLEKDNTISTKKYNSAFNDSLVSHLSTLVNTQLFYTELAINKSENKSIIDFCKNTLVEFQHLQTEMEVIISESKQNEILHKNNKILTIISLTNPYSREFDIDFLQETLKLQWSMKQILSQIKENIDNTDLTIFYEKLIQENELVIDQATTMLNNL